MQMPSGSLSRPALTEDWQNGGFGLYIHWPFCTAKCPYCDFNSHVSRQIDHARWTRAYLSEIDRAGAQTQGRILNTVFFGGGTPSLMAPDTVAAILDRVRATWPMVNDPEITLEANPGSVDAGNFRAYAQAGVNRVSMGIQALNDTDLRRLGRIHTVKEARAAFDIARNQFDRVSFDLIYARQDQGLNAWKTELREALDMSVDHLSLYQLTIENGTAFGDRFNAGGLRGLPNDDLSADMYQITQDVCGEYGMSAYEVSNHARPGSESRHNLIYWRYGDYIGIGPGAHGRVTLDGRRRATVAWSMPDKWLSAAEQDNGTKEQEVLPALEQAQEYLLLGLRISEGIDIARLARFGGSFVDHAKIDGLVDLGMVERRGHKLRATARGCLVLNAVIEELMPLG
ncbi:oxygen-independent coproporphyrinogen-3 oxidase [Primorskyibacter flagellatus]|uniref:Heme chaperone HemW n=1 Tax=Primorskyibacter flagellatus TaxID=1387277 RepID=A0A1W2A719_9RHOB|nr:oxygen-independent coproporphyrinogen-3 oxidase [Primorskyibacter flagellatus]